MTTAALDPVAAPAQAVTVYGAGYVGLVSAACLAALGHRVCCIDTDAARIAALQRAEMPFHEPGLGALVARQLDAGRLAFADETADAADPATPAGRTALFIIAVGTPSRPDGAAETAHVMAVAGRIARRLVEPALVVLKSTVPVGTGAHVQALLRERLRARGLDTRLATVASNPEFLREGSAVQDFMQPDRIVIGADDPEGLAPLRALYAPLMRPGRPLLEMDLRSAEFTKYAANAMLAGRLSLVNELALLAETLGADFEQVRAGVGSDARIGPSFLAPGCGFGGSCLPKDVAALLHAGRTAGVALPLLQAVQSVNRNQQRVLAARLLQRLGGRLERRRIALWGLAFKPGTDDLRQAPALVLLELLLERGATVVAHDPVAMPAAQRLLGERPGLRYAADALSALDEADALLIATDWPLYAAVAPQALRERMRRPLVLDGRNLFDPGCMAACGIDYAGIGRPVPSPERVARLRAALRALPRVAA